MGKAMKYAMGALASLSPLYRSIAVATQKVEMHKALDIGILADIARTRFTRAVADIIIKTAIKRNKVRKAICLIPLSFYSADDIWRELLKGDGV